MSMRNQIIEAALDLFASQGFASTTVAEIEAAAGLAAGSGGLYRHFASKRAVFAAAVDWADEHVYAAAELDARLLDIDRPHDALRAAGETALVAVRKAAPFHLAVLRAGRDAPIEPAQLADRLVLRSYRQFAMWIRTFAAAGVFRRVDAEAYAATALGSIVWFHFAEVFTGTTPGAIDDDRFLDGWVDAHWTSLATAAAASGSTPAATTSS